MSEVLTKYETSKLEALQAALEVLRQAQEGGSCEEAIDVARRRFLRCVERVAELGDS